MSAGHLKRASVLVVGAGIMGAGIAQVAAQAGHSVMLFDMRAGATAEIPLFACREGERVRERQGKGEGEGGGEKETVTLMPHRLF